MSDSTGNRQQTAIVTGAGAGIGEATARALAARGVAVLVTDIDEAAAARVAEAIAADGGTARSARLDTTDAAQRIVVGDVDLVQLELHVRGDLGAVRAQPDRDHARTQSREGLGGRQADARGAAGDEHRLAGEQIGLQCGDPVGG